MLKFIQDISANLGKAITLPAGNYTGIYLESENLAVAAGNVITAGISLILNGETLQNTDILALKDIDNIFFGKPTWAVTGGSPNDTVKIAVLAPFEFPGIPNALDIGGSDTFTLVYRPENVVSGSLSIYGVFSAITPENFLPCLTKLQETGSGRVRITIPDENALYLIIEPRNAADKIVVYKDGEVVADAYGIELTKLAEIQHRIEADTLTKAFIDLAPSKIISDVLSDNVEIVIEHGASGTSTVWAYNCIFKGQRIQSSGMKQIMKQESKTKRVIAKRPEMEAILTTPISPRIGGKTRPTPRLTPML